MRKNFILIGVLIIMFASRNACAEASIIENTATIDGQVVCISGRITNVTESKQVTLLVGEPENIIYIDQIASNADGLFSFTFEMPDSAVSTEYSLKIGSDSDAEIYSGSLSYVKTIERKFAEADINIDVTSYVPTVTGNISCIKGKTVTFKAVNSTDNTVIVEDTIENEDGNYSLNYTLPSLATGKDYTVTISCTENGDTLFVINAEIDSAIILVSASGSVQVADNVRLDMRAKTVNSDLIDRSESITANKELSGTIPNLVANISCDISMQGYEKVQLDTSSYFFTQLEKLKIDWLYSSADEQFYSADGNLYLYSSGTEIKLLKNMEAKFCVSYEDYIYFSNMRDAGKIYKCKKDGSDLTLVSEDSGSWLYVKDGYLYYKNNDNNRIEKSINISAND